MMTNNINYPPCRRNKINKDDIKVLNRIALNKMLTNKDDRTVDINTWKSKT